MSKEVKKPIVHLRVFKGNQMMYDGNGKVLNPNQLVKLKHDTIEWKNFLNNLVASSYTSAKVEKALYVEYSDGKETVEEADSLISDLQKEVDAKFFQEKAPLTPEQQQIADLTARLDALTKQSAPAKGTVLIEELRADYKALVGKDADTRWKEARILEEMETFKADQK
jgi:hypothetical protein